MEAFFRKPPKPFIRLLVESGARLDLRDSLDRSGWNFFCVSQAGEVDEELFELALSKGHKLCLQNIEDFLNLTNAPLPLLKKLVSKLDRMPHPDKGQDHQEMSGWLNAAAGNPSVTVDTIRYLLELGCLVNIKGGPLEMSPLHWQCNIGHKYNTLVTNNLSPFSGIKKLPKPNSEICIALIQAGAEVNSTNSMHQTPLHLLALKENLDTDCWKVLVHSGAKLKEKDMIGRTPVSMLEESGASPGEIKVLTSIKPKGCNIF